MTFETYVLGYISREMDGQDCCPMGVPIVSSFTTTELEEGSGRRFKGSVHHCFALRC